MKEKFPNTKKPSHRHVCGEFWNLPTGEGNITGREKKKTPQTTHLTATPSGEVAQTRATAISERGLNTEARAACLM